MCSSASARPEPNTTELTAVSLPSVVARWASATGSILDRSGGNEPLTVGLRYSSCQGFPVRWVQTRSFLYMKVLAPASVSEKVQMSPVPRDGT